MLLQFFTFKLFRSRLKQLSLWYPLSPSPSNYLWLWVSTCMLFIHPNHIALCSLTLPDAILISKVSYLEYFFNNSVYSYIRVSLQILLNVSPDFFRIYVIFYLLEKIYRIRGILFYFLDFDCYFLLLLFFLVSPAAKILVQLSWVMNLQSFSCGFIWSSIFIYFFFGLFPPLYTYIPVIVLDRLLFWP